jgi:predicted O-methyltransferase YrrM
MNSHNQLNRRLLLNRTGTAAVAGWAGGVFRSTGALVLALLISSSQAQTPKNTDKPPRLTAADVSAQYLARHPSPRDDAEKKIVAVLEDAFTNQSRGMGNVPPEDGRLLRLLTESLGAKTVVELGAANGYSALWFCLALRTTGGKLTTLELDTDRIALARANFKRAGVEDLVTLVEGDAHETVKKLSGPIDLVLIDAEKEGFTDYLKQLKPLVRKGGLIIAHDSSGLAHQMDIYFKAIAADSDLETVFVDASRWGMAITRKMR